MSQKFLIFLIKTIRNFFNWHFDPADKLRVNAELVKKYYNFTKSTPLSQEGAVIEEEALMKLIPIRSEMRILDLGCGDGRWARLVINRCGEYVGIDFSEELIKKAKKAINNKNATFFVCRLKNILLMKNMI